MAAECHFSACLLYIRGDDGCEREVTREGLGSVGPLVCEGTLQVGYVVRFNDPSPTHRSSSTSRLTCDRGKGAAQTPL